MPRIRLSGFSLDTFRRQLANVDALPQLCVLGVLSGLITGSFMVLFRSLLMLGAVVFMPHGDPEAFEQLSRTVRVLLPILAVFVIGMLLWRQPAAARKVGVGHVIERLTDHQGRFPMRNWINQWWIGALSVMGGLSAGREGPAIHLGAAASSGMGELLRLPHNSLRVLVACGTAAGISASFNTPIAGVIFAMEVVMMEYTIVGFMPVILAACMAAVISQLVYGSEPAFAVPELAMGSLFNFYWIVIMAFGIGLLAGLFLHVARSARVGSLPMWLRFALVAALAAALAWSYPQVQGIGYDSLSDALFGKLTVDVLVALALGKLLLTAFSVACGVPVSIIGPVLVIGAAAGALMGLFGVWLWPGKAADPGLFAMIGMAAMMGAVLQAPLAALMALLELTHHPHILLPGMLAVVVSGLTARQLCRCDGIFINIKRKGMHPLQHPLMQALSRVSVPAVMERSIARTRRRIDKDQAKSLLESNPMWILIERSSDDKPTLALKAADLALWLMELENKHATPSSEQSHGQKKDSREKARPPLTSAEDEEIMDTASRNESEEASELSGSQERVEDGEGDQGKNSEAETLDLLEIPGHRMDLAAISLQATLSEALIVLNERKVDGLYVEHGYHARQKRISGIITREAIEAYYRISDSSTA
ncbi:chloride channel protein [Halomonas binhaiensis]|uniref:chloride channel protein n=1 Tax=Halomonas binhaiensis TaxID=2562282 RepID=UPI001F07FF09|nr:chloride channel protein [Halomonas binhaiensis]